MVCFVFLQESVGGLDFQIKNAEDLVAHFGDGCHISEVDEVSF